MLLKKKYYSYYFVWVLISLFFINSTTLAQKNNGVQKLWCWEIINIGGANPPPEMQNERAKNSSYLAYTELKNNVKITTPFLWMKEKAFSIQLKLVKEQPVKFDAAEVLIQKTKNTLYELVLTEVNTLLVPEKVTALLKSNEVVFEYSQANQKKYFPLKTIVQKNRVLP